MRVRFGSWLVAIALVAASMGPSMGPTTSAADTEPYIPDGRIALGGSSVYAGLRVCAPDCDLQELTSGPLDSDPAWSPTGREIVFTRLVGDADYLLHVLDLTTGTVTQVTHPAPDSPYTTDMDPDWSPDGTTIAFGRLASSADGRATQQIGFLTYRGPHRGEVRVLPFATGPDDPCFLFQIGRRDPSFSPDGRSIAYAANGTPFSMSVRSGTGPALAVVGSPARSTASLGDCAVEGVWVSSVTGHEAERPIAPQLGDATGPSWSPDGASIALLAPDGPYVVPLDSGAPIPISDSEGRRPAPGSAPGASGHTGWDPAGEFLLVDMFADGSERVRYKPDGTGDLDLPEGTHTSGGWSVQCLPADCLTSLTVVKRVAGTDGTYPATFHYSGAVTGEIAIVDAPFSYEGSLSTKIGPGPAVVTEAPDPDWPLTSIECDAPATVDLAARSVVVDIAAGTVVTCLFLSDLGTTVPSDRPDTTDAPGTSSPVTCSTYEGDWAAGQYGVDTLIFEVTVPWCHGEGIVRIDGPITVKQVVDPWFVPDWLSPINFRADDGAVTHRVERTDDSTLMVYAGGRFQACSSVVEIIGAVGAPAAVIKILFKAKRLPPLLRRTIIKRILEPFDRAVLGLIRGGAQLSIDDELRRKAFMDLAESLVDGVVAFVLDPAADERFGGVGEFCMETWKPELTISLDASGEATLAALGETISPFWDLRQVYR